MKTENLTHGLFKAVCEVFIIFRAFAKKGKRLFAQVIFAKNSSSKTKTVAFKRRLSYVAVVAENFIIKSV